MPEFLGNEYTTEIIIPASMDKPAITDVVKDFVTNPIDIDPVVAVAISATTQLKLFKCKMLKTIAATSNGKVVIVAHA